MVTILMGHLGGMILICIELFKQRRGVLSTCWYDCCYQCEHIRQSWL